MNVTGTWQIVSSPDFDDDYLRMEVEPYVELAQSGNRVSGSSHVGLQQGEIDGRIEGEGRVGFSFAGMDELDEVHGRGELRIEGARARFVLAYHQGDTFTKHPGGLGFYELTPATGCNTMRCLPMMISFPRTST